MLYMQSLVAWTLEPLELSVYPESRVGTVLLFALVFWVCPELALVFWEQVGVVALRAVAAPLGSRGP